MGEVLKTEVKLLNPTQCSLDELANSTVDAFDVLKPWCELAANEHDTLWQVTSQVEKYVKALNYSISAANYGYTVASDAIALAGLLGQGTESEVEDYLRRMLGIATKGHRNARNAHECFRGVRMSLITAISSARDKERDGSAWSSTPGSAERLSLLKELENGIPILEQFSRSVTMYASWWNLMEMAGFAMKERSPTSEEGIPIFSCDSLRTKGVVRQWEKIEADYLAYTNKIKALQDSYPHILRKDEDLSPISEYFSGTGVSRTSSATDDTLGTTNNPETITRRLGKYLKKKIFRRPDYDSCPADRITVSA